MICHTQSKKIDASEHLNLVMFVARKFVKKNVEDSDEYSDGMLGLTEAIQNFDETKGKFSTYATTCIRNKIISGIRNRNRRVFPDAKLPENILSNPCQAFDRYTKMEALINVILNDKNEPEEYLDIIKSHYLDGMTKSAIAKKYKISVEAVRKRIDGTANRIRAKYSNVFAERMDES